jgi:hypothetical protein
MRSTVRHRAGVWGLCAFLAACAAEEERVESNPVAHQDSNAFGNALAAARAKRAQLDALSPPARDGDESSNAVSRYIKGPLTAWMHSATDRTRDTAGAYGAAARAALSGEAEVDVIAEALAAFQSLADRTVDAATRALPAAWQSVPTLARAVHKELEETTFQLWVEPTLQRCVERADARAVRTPAAERCRSSFARAKSDPSFWMPTAQSEPCVFSGSVWPNAASLTLDGPDHGPPLTLARHNLILRVDRLEIPRAPGEGYPVVVSYPIIARGSLDASARPIALPERVDLVAHHVWIEPGTAMSAQRVGQDQVKLSTKVRGHRSDRDAPTRAGAPHLGIEEPEVDTTAAEVTQTAACASLALAGSPRYTSPDEGDDATLPSGRWITLFGDPQGKQPVARLWGETALRIRRDRGGLWHVAHRGERVAFDGWVPGSTFTPEDSGGVAILAASVGTPRRIPNGGVVVVRMRPDVAAPVVFSLAPQALVYVGKSVGDFAEIEIHGLDGTFYLPHASAPP